MDYDELDPGIRETVRLLRDAGFETTDSGDGVSKPKDWYECGEAMPFPHVVAQTIPGALIVESIRMQTVLGRGWVVEGSYQPLTGSALIFARTPDPREVV